MVPIAVKRLQYFVQSFTIFSDGPSSGSSPAKPRNAALAWDLHNARCSSDVVHAGQTSQDLLYVQAVPREENVNRAGLANCAWWSSNRREEVEIPGCELVPQILI